MNYYDLLKEILLLNCTNVEEESNSNYLIVGVEFMLMNEDYRIGKVNLVNNDIEVYKFKDHQSYMFTNLNEINSIIEDYSTN